MLVGRAASAVVVSAAECEGCWLASFLIHATSRLKLLRAKHEDRCLLYPGRQVGLPLPVPDGVEAESLPARRLILHHSSSAYMCVHIC